VIEESGEYVPLSVDIPRSASNPDKESVEVTRLLNEVSGSDVDLRPTDEGCGGVYFVGRSGRHALGIFKPEDEEFGAENNPKGYNNEERRNPGVPREVAAYQLDQRYGGWSRVPATTQVIATKLSGEEKRGSLQAHVEHIDSAENFGSSMMPTLDTHKIAVLDIRLFNTDRHFANILVSKQNDNFRLTPIDHGAILPGCLDLGKARFEWMQFKQSKMPMSSETLSYIEALDIDGDAACLRALGIEEESITTMMLSTKVLQLGAQRGLSLWDIGNCMQRDLWTDDLSPLETAIFKIAGVTPTGTEIRDLSTQIAEEVIFSVSEGNQELYML
jgi:hypothetical protein